MIDNPIPLIRLSILMIKDLIIIEAKVIQIKIQPCIYQAYFKKNNYINDNKKFSCQGWFTLGLIPSKPT